jgi:hypothetical protein
MSESSSTAFSRVGVGNLLERGVGGISGGGAGRMQRFGSRGRFEEQKLGEEAIIGFDSL